MPPLAIGAAIAGVAGIGSAVIGANAAKKAGRSAERAAAESSAVQREIYDRNANALAPYVNAGVPATQHINALLGLGGVSTSPAVAPGAPDWNQYLLANPDVSREYFDDNDERTTFATPQDYAQWHYSNYGSKEGRAFPTVPQATPQATAQAAGTSQAAAEQAFDTFRNNTGYKFNLSEGLNAVRGGYSGSGTLQSGAALKALQERGSNIADGTFYNYLGAVGNQQGVGLSAASAQAGVGQNYANSMTAINTNKGDAQANAALAKGQSWGNALNGLASSGSYLAGRYA